MSLRIDSTEWISGAMLIGETGGGVIGSLIPSSGDNGAGYAYNDLSLPADNTKEICGRITTWPSAGTLTAYEDTSFTFTGAADGTYSFAYQIYVDYAATGSPTTVTLTVGGVNATATGALAAASISAPSASAFGAASASGALGVIVVSAPTASANGTTVGNAVAMGVLAAIDLATPSGAATGGGYGNRRFCCLHDNGTASREHWSDALPGRHQCYRRCRLGQNNSVDCCSIPRTQGYLMHTVLICRKWNSPEISITMDKRGIEVSMSIHDFVTALADEAAEPLAAQVAGNAGNPFLLLTNKQMVARIVSAVESEAMRDILSESARRVFAGMKAETAKVM